MAYPFPRCGTAVSAPPPPATGGAAGYPQPWAAPPLQAAAWQLPAAPAPCGWDVGQAAAAEDLADEASDDGVECNEDVIAGFVQMELRKAARGGGSRRRRLPAGIPRPAPDRAVALPQQEDEASRSALVERAQKRELEKRLYGRHAPEVRALEASLNAAFDRIAQADAPALWPSAPLRGT